MKPLLAILAILILLTGCVTASTCLTEAITVANNLQCKDKLLFIEGNGPSERHVQLWICGANGRYHLLTGYINTFQPTHYFTYGGYMEKVKILGWQKERKN